MSDHPFEPVDHADPAAPPTEASSHDAWPGWSAPGLSEDPDTALQFAAASAESEHEHASPPGEQGHERPDPEPPDEPTPPPAG